MSIYRHDLFFINIWSSNFDEYPINHIQFAHYSSIMLIKFCYLLRNVQKFDARYIEINT